MTYAFLVWLLDFVTTAEYFKISDSLFIVFMYLFIALGGSALFWFFSLEALPYSAGREEISERKAWIRTSVFDKFFPTFITGRKPKFLLSLLLTLGVLGSMADSLIPKDKNTIYLMVGAYVMQGAVDNCAPEKGEDQTTCSKVIKSIQGKIEKAVEEFDAEETAKGVTETVADKVADKIVEKSTEPQTSPVVDEKTAAEVKGKVADATGKVASATEKVADKVADKIVEKVLE